MNNPIQISAEQFEKIKLDVLNNNIGRKSINLQEIKLISDSALAYAGMPFALSREGYKSLMKIVGISDTIRKNLIEKYGKNFADKLVETMSKAVSQSKESVVMLIDTKKKTIVNFIASKADMVTNASLIQQAERIIDGSQLIITNFKPTNEGGFFLSTLSDNSEWNLKGNTNEAFKFGLNFSNDPFQGSRMSPYNMRLVCTNGMVTQNEVGSTILTNNKPSWDQFYHNVQMLKNDNFRPTGFDDRLKQVMTVNASVKELEVARNIIRSNSKMELLQLENYLPILETENAYKKAGVDLLTLSDKQKQNAVSDVPYFEVINAITDLSSHNYGYEVQNTQNLQKFAGKMFSGQPDMKNFVINPFK